MPSLILSLTKFKNQNDKICFRIVADNIVFVDTILRNRFVVPEWQHFCEEMTDIFNICKEKSLGKVCQYIPQLSKVDPNLWAVSVCTIDGQR